jgi:DNA/RNA-binding domain of Phe-tRNA-synthetase-like protein
MMDPLIVEPHPLLSVRAFVSAFSPDLAAYGARSPLAAAQPPSPPFEPADDSARAAIRELLRHAGFRPTGRSKPASEYLIRSHAEGGLRPINCAVDACNIVSLHSGLPISVIDLERAELPLRIAVASPGTSYVFNQAGQEIDVGRLICLHDSLGPCANAVKDAQRTKTSDQTRFTLSVIWSSHALQARTDAALAFYLELLAAAGVATGPQHLVSG